MLRYFVVSLELGKHREQWWFDAPNAEEAHLHIAECMYENCGALAIEWSGTLEQAHDEALAEDLAREWDDALLAAPNSPDHDECP